MKIVPPFLLSFALFHVAGCTEELLADHSHTGDKSEISAQVSSEYKTQEFHWGSGRQTDIATHLSFRFTQPTHCSWIGSRVSSSPDQGIDSVFVLKTENSLTWAASSTNSLARVELASQEVPHLIPGSLTGNYLLSTEVDVNKWMIAGFFGKDVDFTQSSYAPGHGMAFSLYCNQAFSVDPVRQGHEVSLINANSLHGTLVDVFGLAQVVAEGHFHRTITSPESGFWMGYGDHFEDAIDEGVVELATPDSLASWSWDSNTTTHLEHLTSGSGSYDLTLRRVSTSPGVGFWWSVIYGFSETIPANVADLDSSAIVY